MKRCLDCEGLFSLVNFTKDLSKKDGKNIYCRDCCNRKLREKRKHPDYNFNRRNTRHKYKSQEASYALKMRYGITLEEKYEMLKKQGNCCKICKSETSDQRDFSVDHCHKSGKIRGILCGRCNRVLGQVKENISILNTMIDYLNQGDF